MTEDIVGQQWETIVIFLSTFLPKEKWWPNEINILSVPHQLLNQLAYFYELQ
jgi:hypothetical protein